MVGDYKKDLWIHLSEIDMLRPRTRTNSEKEREREKEMINEGKPALGFGENTPRYECFDTADWTCPTTAKFSRYRCISGASLSYAVRSSSSGARFTTVLKKFAASKLTRTCRGFTVPMYSMSGWWRD